MKYPTYLMVLLSSLLFALLSLQATPQSTAFSHSTWNNLLSKYVSASGKVNYGGFKQAEATLDQYLTQVSAAKPANWSRNEQLAFWINAYNAYTVKLILNHYPLKSIQNIDKPWDQQFFSIGGQQMSLNHIEHQIIRKRFNEPRIHFAVNCAAKSCPKLLNEAYTAAKLEQQLERQTKTFINQTTYNQLDPKAPKLSRIFDWYGDDFKKTGSLIDFINRYANVKIEANATLDFLAYDWRLNA